MFLLVRSALCIGLVVSALPERSATAPAVAAFDTVAAEAGGVATSAIDRFCRHDPGRCRRALEGVAMATGARTSVAGRVSARSGPPAGATRI